MSSVERYGAGELPGPYALTAGDFILVKHHKGAALISKLISFGERVRGDREGAQWTHSAMIVSNEGDLVEALGQGVTKTHISRYKVAEFYVVRCGGTPTWLRSNAVKQALGMVGQPYDVLDFISLSCRILFRWRLSFSLDGPVICSQLVARCTEKYIVAYPARPENMMPSMLARYWLRGTGHVSSR